MPGSEYTAAPATGRLKLKGVADARVDKKKKRKRPKTDTDADADATMTNENSRGDGDEFNDRSVVLKSLADEDSLINKSKAATNVNNEDKEGKGEDLATTGERQSEPEPGTISKTAAEIRFEEQRRKRLEERLKREGVKTHKQRVEELNRYLSGLSEHHDMPKIGPG